MVKYEYMKEKGATYHSLKRHTGQNGTNFATVANRTNDANGADGTNGTNGTNRTKGTNHTNNYVPLGGYSLRLQNPL